MADDDNEIILSELPDDELVLQMHDDLYDGMRDEVVEGVNILLARGWTPYDVLTKALVEGMRIVGIDFRDGILFVPEVLLAANAMKAGMAILKPLLIETGAPRLGKMVIGTVKGDIHDILRYSPLPLPASFSLNGSQYSRRHRSSVRGIKSFGTPRCVSVNSVPVVVSRSVTAAIEKTPSG
jgi:hypothetical protein